MTARILSIFLFSFLLLGFGFSALSVTLSLSDSGIAEGDTTTLTATISGSDSGVVAELSSDGILDGYLTTSPTAIGGVSTQAVGTVSSTTSKSWIIQGVSSGTYDLLVTVSGTESSTTGSTTLTVDSPANVVLEDYTCDSDLTLSDGEIYTINYTLTNNGGVSASILNDATYSAHFSSVDAPALSNEYITINQGQTKTVSWSFVADASTSARTGSIIIDLTGGNLSETITCGAYSIAVTTTNNPGGGSGGSGGSYEYEFIAEQNGKTQVNYYTGKELVIKLKIQNSINIVPGVDVNVTYPDGSIKTIKTTTDGKIVFTPTLTGNYTFTYKSGTKTYTKTINVLAGSLDDELTDEKAPLDVIPKDNESNVVDDSTTGDNKTNNNSGNTPIEEQGLPIWGLVLIIVGVICIIGIISYFTSYRHK